MEHPDKTLSNERTRVDFIGKIVYITISNRHSDVTLLLLLRFKFKYFLDKFYKSGSKNTKSLNFTYFYLSNIQKALILPISIMPGSNSNY